MGADFFLKAYFSFVFHEINEVLKKIKYVYRVKLCQGKELFYISQ
jgi:hypothetical protein